MSLDRWKKQIITSGEQLTTSIVREGRQRLDPDTVEAIQRTARDNSRKAVTYIGAHMPDASSVQAIINNVSRHQLEPIVRKSLAGLPPEARSELGKVAQQYVQKSSGLSAPPGLERADPAAVAAILTQLLQSPQGLAQFAALFGGMPRGGAADLIALSRNPAAQQFLGKMLANIARVK